MVGDHALNADYHLTRKVKTGNRWSITSGTLLRQGFEGAGVLLRRWHQRRERFRLNGPALNGQALPNVWVSQRKRAIGCEIETRPRPAVAVIRLAGLELTRQDLTRPDVVPPRGGLNRARLPRAPVCRVLFGQKDHYAPAQAGFEAAANRFTVTQWPAV